MFDKTKCIQCFRIFSGMDCCDDIDNGIAILYVEVAISRNINNFIIGVNYLDVTVSFYIGSFANYLYQKMLFKNGYDNLFELSKKLVLAYEDIMIENKFIKERNDYEE